MTSTSIRFKQSTTTNASAMDGLPKQFLSSLKILFDILDENRTGFVRLKDIESRWSDDGVKGLPAGIVDGLRKVTPSNGLLSFEKFVAGLKLVLNTRAPRIENEYRKPLFTSKENFASFSWYRQGHGEIENKLDNKNYNTVENGQESEINHHRQPPPYSNLGNRRLTQQGQRQHSDSNIDQYRIYDDNKNEPKPPYSPMEQQKYNGYTIKPDVSDYPNPSGPSQQSQYSSHFNSGRRGSQTNMPHSHQSDKAPTIPPRTGRSASLLKKSLSGPDLLHSQSPPAVPPRERNQNTHIISDLRNWQREWTMNQSQGLGRSFDQNIKHNSRNPSYVQDRDHAIYANIEQFQNSRDHPQNKVVFQKAPVRRHGSGRRHTLTSGIDHNMMKRMKQLDEETAMLKSGLAVLDSARDWYNKQLSVVADKQAMMGKVNYTDNSLEAHQERMNFQRARISEVNQQLKTLSESSEKGFPLHMNLAISSRAPSITPRDKGNQLAILMERNRRLMEDMTQKNDQIAQLEKEKTSLVRDLFETRSKNKVVHDDTTFM